MEKITKMGEEALFYDWDKKRTLEEFEKKYKTEDLYGYPSLAKYKLPECIKLKVDVVPTSFSSREEAIKWIDENMSEEQIAYTGF